MLVRKIRVLRLKYNITINELAQGAKRSPSWLSAVELGGSSLREQTKETALRGFEEVIASRQRGLYALERDFHLHKDSLFDGVKEGDPL